MFAIQNGGLCFSSSSAEKTYDKYGRTSDFSCVTYNQDGLREDGTGGPMANSVYQIVDGGMFWVIWSFTRLWELSTIYL